MESNSNIRDISLGHSFVEQVLIVPSVPELSFLDAARELDSRLQRYRLDDALIRVGSYSRTLSDPHWADRARLDDRKRINGRVHQFQLAYMAKRLIQLSGDDR